MICKFCNSELEDGSVICPVCGGMLTEESDLIGEALEDTLPEEQLQQEMPEMEVLFDEVPEEQPDLPDEPETTVKPKRKLWIWLVAALGCLLLGLVVFYQNYIGFDIVFGNRENNVQYRGSYTVKDFFAKRKTDEVVATLNNMQLTNGELQVHYWMLVRTAQSHTGYDLSQPLDKQWYSKANNLTWQQYFLDMAIGDWRWYTTFFQLAIEDDSHTDYAAMYRSLKDHYMENLRTAAAKYGYESIDAMVKADMGASASAEGYAQYMAVNAIATTYYSDVYQSIDPTMEQMDAYFTARAEEYAKSGITKETGKWVDVRHILLKPESDTQEAWDACYAKAETLLNQWKNGEATEASFGELANANSVDPGSNTKGGLYSGVPKGYMVKEFDDWIFDESRKNGDTGIVKTEHGYHIMYFVNIEEAWILNTREDYKISKVQEMLNAAYEKWPMDVNYKNIVLSELTFGKS